MSNDGIAGLIERKYFGVKRRVLARTFPIGMHFYVLNEYPKSGGSWIGEMFSDALQIPYPRDGNNILGRSLIHGHFMRPYGMDGSIVVWRDGRDVMTSSYFYYTRAVKVRQGHRSNSDLVARTHRFMSRQLKSESGEHDAAIDFSSFLKMMLTSPVYPSLTWQQFVAVWAKRERCHHVKFEDFKHDAGGSLQRLVRAVSGKHISDSRCAEIVLHRSFKAQSGRDSGTEDDSHFLRKGIVGDWRNHFSCGDEQYFASIAGSAMALLKYEL